MRGRLESYKRERCNFRGSFWKSFAETIFTHGGSLIYYVTQREKIVGLIILVPDHSLKIALRKFGAIHTVYISKVLFGSTTFSQQGICNYSEGEKSFWGVLFKSLSSPNVLVRTHLQKNHISTFIHYFTLSGMAWHFAQCKTSSGYAKLMFTCMIVELEVIFRVTASATRSWTLV